MPATAKRSRSAPVAAKLRDTRDVLEAAGLRPVIDTVLARCLSECPNCRAGASDPLDIFRPLIVGCYSREAGAPVRMLCTASGCDTDAIQRGLRAPAVDWEAIAEDYAEIAAAALALIDAERRPTLELAA